MSQQAGRRRWMTRIILATVILGLTLVGWTQAVTGLESPSTWSPAGLSGVLVPSGAAGAQGTSSADWPQVGRVPQRTNYSPETLGTNFRVAWTHAFQPERVYPQVQAIVYAGKVFVGTESGSLYALDAATGAERWRFKAAGPILNSVAAADGKVFFGCMDGAVYAVDANTGTQVWKRQLSGRLGFSTAPVFADDKVMLGGRNGVFYALALGDGHTIWQYSVGSPIYQTAAWNNGKVYFGARDMHVYALNTNTTEPNGSLAWKSQKVNAMTFKDYWPVVHQGKVLIRAMMKGDNFFAFDEATGAQTITLPQWDGQTMNGATTPPCVDRDGLLVVPSLREPDSYKSGWGRLDLSRQEVTDILRDSSDPDAGFGNIDENLNPTCSANLILSMHTEEYNANYTGAFDLDSRRWTEIRPGWTNGQMSTNTQGGGGNPASISNGVVYHISYHELIARTTR